MKIAIMQPYFFPYLGYFSLIVSCELFIVFDPVQYIRKGWINRNRILKKGGGVKYINLPIVKTPRDTLISEIRMNNQINWKASIIQNLDYYRLNAPYYHDVAQLLEECFDQDTENLTQFLTVCLQKTCAYLGISFHSKIYSKEKIQHPKPMNAGDWAFYISKFYNASTYHNPIGGRDIFNPEKFEKSGIQLLFIENRLNQYDQAITQFIPGLSIIDVMMFNSKEECRKLIHQYKLHPSRL
jgi:hypothetical protein